MTSKFGRWHTRSCGSIGEQYATVMQFASGHQGVCVCVCVCVWEGEGVCRFGPRLTAIDSASVMQLRQAYTILLRWAVRLASGMQQRQANTIQLIQESDFAEAGRWHAVEAGKWHAAEQRASHWRQTSSSQQTGQAHTHTHMLTYI